MSSLFILIGSGLLMGLSLAAMVYAIVLWRNGSLNNDILMAERGQRLAIIFGVAFVLFLILFIVSFVSRRQESVQLSEQEAQPVGISARQNREALLLIEAHPLHALEIRNPQIQLFFNQEVDLASIESNLLVQTIEGEEEVVGEWTVEGARAFFQSNQSCPPPNNGLHCFDAETSFEVMINGALTSTDGDAFRCSLFASTENCTFAFTTGDLIDAQAPEVRLTLPYRDSAVSTQASVLTEALSKDNQAMTSILFFVDNEEIGFASVASGNLLTEFRGITQWQTDNVEIGSTHQIQAVAIDLAGNRGQSQEVPVEVLSESCFDGQQNEDETGIDCGGSLCRSCAGVACVETAQCSTDLCFDGICRDFPLIEELISPQGIPGNYITIRGRNFGTEPGRLVFLGQATNEDDVEAVAPQCDLYWTKNEVVLQVPEGAVSGPVQLFTSDGFFDRSDDAKGETILFQVSGEQRPGLCPLTPNTQTIGESVQITGIRLGEEVGLIHFGDTLAEEIEGWSDSSIGHIRLPSMEAGDIPVTVEVDGEETNPVMLTALPSPVLPQLHTISPNRAPAGQIISILGENYDESLVLNFMNPQTGEITPADTRLPDACEGNISPRQRAFRIPRIDPGVYQVFAETTIGKSNRLNITVVQSGFLPGLCNVTPDNGPVGTEITLSGENFGDEQGVVRFTPRVDSGDVLSWSDNRVVIAVPPTVSNGPVQVANADGNLSNEFNYTVGQCSPDSCGEGFQCCGNGACQVAGTCTDAVSFCQYSWVFGTGDDLGGAPRVIEDASCRNNVQSPSPFNQTKDACLNAGIAARFTHDMLDSSMSRDHITVRKCNTGPTFAPQQCQSVIPLSSLDIINSGQPGEGFIAMPQNRLEQDTWYQVELSTAFTSANGTPLLQPFQWQFKTQIGDGICAIDHVEVTPASATLRGLQEQQSYTALPTALNCNVLDPDAFTWNWLSSDTGKARVNATTAPRTKARAISPTQPGPPVRIIGSIPEQNVDDEGQLTITLEPPRLIDQWPNCQEACVNASLGARFDQAMQQESFNATTVQLFECPDASCNGATAVPVKSIQYNATDHSVYFLPQGGDLKAGTHYRILLGDIRSLSGQALANRNFDRNGDGSIDSYAWIFRVREDGQPCAIDHIDVIPETATSFLIPEDFDYFSFPVSSPDACNSNGQLLNPESYDWGWASGNRTIATVTNDDNVPPSAFIDPYQVTTSAGQGTTSIDASAQGVTGASEFKVVCGFENDTDCPSPATLESHAVGTDSCCHERPSIVTTIPQDGAQGVCTTLAAEVQFNQVMEQASVLDHVFLERNFGSEPCPGQDLSFWGRIKSFARNLLSFAIPSTQAQAENWCVVDSGITLVKNEFGSLAQVFPDTPLTPNHAYRLRVEGDETLADETHDGVRNLASVPLRGQIISEFTTGEAECSLDLIEVTITPPEQPASRDIFFCAVRNDCPADANPNAEGNQHKYVAIGRDISGFHVPADFRWAVGPEELLSLNTTEGDTIEVTSKAENGFSTVTVFGEAKAPSRGRLSRTVEVKVFLCENPWPSLLDFPYADELFNFDSFYCRDAGEPGTQDDLPPLTLPITNENVGESLQESLFLVE